MPNWCDNFIQISGPGYVQFLEELNSLGADALFMESFVPYDNDPEFKRIVEAGEYLLYPHSTFYGTKWDFYAHEVLNNATIDENFMSFQIDTAWSPPLEFLRKFAKKYDLEITIDYSEPGCDFCGKASFDKDGYTDECYTYMQGMYILDEDQFWMEVSSTVDNLEWILNESELLQDWDNLKAEVEKDFDFVLSGDLTELIAMYKEAHDNYLKEQQNEKVDNDI